MHQLLLDSFWPLRKNKMCKKNFWVVQNRISSGNGGQNYFISIGDARSGQKANSSKFSSIKLEFLDLYYQCCNGDDVHLLTILEVSSTQVSQSFWYIFTGSWFSNVLYFSANYLFYHFFQFDTLLLITKGLALTVLLLVYCGAIT